MNKKLTSGLKFLKKHLFIVIVTLQVLFLVVMASLNYVIEEFGDVIHLETEPYDPRDVFYGDYINLSYTINEIHPSYWFGSENVKPNEVIYVLLKPDERDIYRVKAASDKKLEAQGDEVVISGRYRHKDYEQVHRVSYGMNRYYIEEGTGEEYEQINSKMIVTVAVSPWGQKKILDVEEME
ncbi:GDYXXLXY domain-containing protein [Aquisalibacillus elongatus]|uniref:Putative membrane-anchored protein n=1 Tax=Aquisalibacillus elongatus TaxID=485577 RepID=A0A3N5B4M9_9BACI|nr:GDYXXLXY domain-containing protein [Aquisalibacillus elongatus]RPF52069.1 putative membrane-anchored protein [Aquisalibacillus elongatus]